MRLTDLAVKKLKPKEKPFKVSDGRALYLLVQPAGGKLWRFDYRHLGARRTMALGRYPDVSLGDARKGLAKARSTLAAGIDPVSQKKVERAIAKHSAATTFKVVSDEWLAKREREKISPNSLKKERWLLRVACDSFGSRPIVEITPAEALDALRKLEARGKFDSATTMRAVVGRVFRYAIGTSRAERDVTVDLKGALITAKVVHRPALFDPDKIGELLRAIDGYTGHHPTKVALWLAPRLFTRPGELRYAEWSEFENLAKPAPLWRIPGSRMKVGLDHIVPLSSQCIAVLREYKAISNDEKYLFPSIRDSNRVISDNTLNAALRRLGYSTDEVTTHGFRRTASTLLNEQNQFESDWIERQLAHVIANNVRGAYNAAQWLPQRRAMMQWWSDYLDTLKASAGLLG